MVTSMIKRILAIVFIALVVIVLSVTCAPDTPNRQLISDVFGALEQTATTGVAEIDTELERIYQNLYETEEKILKLEQVMQPALEWVEYQETVDRRPGNWATSVNQEELDKLINDQYKVTKIEIYVESSNTPDQKFSSTIKVLDLETGTIERGQVTKSMLEELQKSLETQAEKKLEAREQLIAAMNDILSSSSGLWEIQRTVDHTYIISGPNLGWADDIVAGKWTYNVDTKVLEPSDSSSAALHNLLSGSI